MKQLKYVTKYENVDLESKKIIKYQIKEEWIWDRQRSERVCRIIRIAPILEYEDDGEIKRKTPLLGVFRSVSSTFCQARGLQHVQ